MSKRLMYTNIVNIRRFVCFTLIVLVCLSRPVRAMEQPSDELSVCSVCQEQPLRSDQSLVYGDQLFEVPPCVHNHVHHDACMAQLLNAHQADTRCPFCRSSLRDEPAIDLAPLSRVVLMLVRAQPHDVYRGPTAPIPDDLHAMAEAAALPPPPPDLRPAFFAAVDIGDLASMQQLMAQGADVNVVWPDSGKTALIIASEAGNVPMVQALIRDGHANCDARDSQNYNALMYAARSGHADVVKSLFHDGHIRVDQNVDALELGYRFKPVLERFYHDHRSLTDDVFHALDRVQIAAARDGIDGVARYLADNTHVEGIDRYCRVDEHGFTWCNA